jgi:predicted solute-binding protein
MATCTRCDKNKKATTAATSCTVSTSTHRLCKCNLDTAISITNDKVGAGACIHDEKGNSIAAMTSNKEGAMTISETKV